MTRAFIGLLALAAVAGGSASGGSASGGPAQGQLYQGDPTVIASIEAWAPAYGVSVSRMEALGWCESELGLDTASPAGAVGPWQYMPGGVWLSTPLGRAGVSVYDASWDEQTEMTAWALANGYGSAWACN